VAWLVAVRLQPESVLGTALGCCSFPRLGGYLGPPLTPLTATSCGDVCGLMCYACVQQTSSDGTTAAVIPRVEPVPTAAADRCKRGNISSCCRMHAWSDAESYPCSRSCSQYSFCKLHVCALVCCAVVCCADHPCQPDIDTPYAHSSWVTDCLHVCSQLAAHVDAL
jgi:hypothetical protein